MKRSLFGLALCYNALPQICVDATTVQSPQAQLQKALLKYAERRSTAGSDWERFYSVDWRRFPRTKLDEFFM